MKNISDIAYSVIKRYKNLFENGQKCHKYIKINILKIIMRNNHHNKMMNMKMINKHINLI